MYLVLLLLINSRQIRKRSSYNLISDFLKCSTLHLHLPSLTPSPPPPGRRRLGLSPDDAGRGAAKVRRRRHRLHAAGRLLLRQKGGARCGGGES